MKKPLLLLTCSLLLACLIGCSEKDEAVPCVQARVIDIADPCSGGVVLELTWEGDYVPDTTCGFGSPVKYVTVDNLPQNLKYVDARFTCQIEKTASGKACIAIYPVYETATIKRICSSETILPR